MEWFNLYGLVFITVIMIPNILFVIKCKEGFQNKWSNKAVEAVEQIGRFGCFSFMIINIPVACIGFISDKLFIIYLIVNALLVALYCIIWIICFKKQSVFKALSLSILPSVIFIFSGIIYRSLPLVLSAMLFAPSHILISYKNAK